MDRTSQKFKTGMKFKTEIKPSVSLALCAVLVFAFCSCDSFAKEDKLELKSELEIAGIEEKGAEWGKDENVQDTGELPDRSTNVYGMEQGGTVPLLY